MAYEDLIQQYIAAHPGATEEEAQKGILAFRPNNDSQLTNLNLPSANAMGSDYNVNKSDSTATANGALPNPVADMTDYEKQKAGIPLDAPAPNIPTYGEQTPPKPISGMPDIPSGNITYSPATPDLSQFTKGMEDYNKLKAPATPTAVKPDTKAPISDVANAITAPVSNDNAKREAGLTDIEKQRTKNNLMSLGAGIGDTISNTAAVFGGQGGAHSQQDLVKRQKEETDSQKAELETKIQNDPQSDISKSYREMVLKIAPDLKGNSNFENMSAKAIGDKLPLIDTMMKASAAKDVKEMGMKQLQSNKELSMEMQKGNERDRLWNKGIETLNQVRGDKPLVDSETMRNGAISAYQAIDNIQKQGRSPNQFEYYDLLGQLWKARNGSSVTNEELKAMDAKTLQHKLGPIGTFFTGDPKAITTPEATKAIKEFVVQSGQTADQIHDSYMQTRGIGGVASRMKELYPEDADRLSKMSRGQSFAEATGYNNKLENPVNSQSKQPGQVQTSADSTMRKTAAGHSYTVSQ